MNGFVGYVSRTQSVDLPVECSDLDRTQESEVLTHKVMEVSEGYVGFLHLRFETALEYPFTFSSLQNVDLQQYLQNKVFIDERFAIFYTLLTL